MPDEFYYTIDGIKVTVSGVKNKQALLAVLEKLVARTRAEIEDRITPEEARRLLKQPPPRKKRK